MSGSLSPISAISTIRTHAVGSSGSRTIHTSVFCRFTQLGLLRLLTTGAVMGEDKVLSQTEAWVVYDRWIQDDRVSFVEESSTLEARFRALTQDERPATKDWADSYLYAFAETADFT